MDAKEFYSLEVDKGNRNLYEIMEKYAVHKSSLALDEKVQKLIDTQDNIIQELRGEVKSLKEDVHELMTSWSKD